MLPTVTKYYLSHTEWLFHCHIKIKLPVCYDADILEHCFDLLAEVDRKYNSYQEDSFFDRINRNAGHFVAVDNTTVQLISSLKEISRIVNGNYDISIMPLLRLWGFYCQDSARVPRRSELDGVLQLVDYSRIEVNENRVKIGVGQELTTGSFLKAYAVDCVLDYLRSKGVDDALINAGGSTIYGMNSADHPEWEVRIPHPLAAGENSKTIALHNACLTLSGQANNYLLIDHRRYSHILNARTGMPSSHLQIVLTTNSAFWGDVLATALMASPIEAVNGFLGELKRLHPFSGYLTDESLQNYTL